MVKIWWKKNTQLIPTELYLEQFEASLFFSTHTFLSFSLPCEHHGKRRKSDVRRILNDNAKLKISWFLSYLITALFILKFRTSTKILHKLQFAFTIQLQSVFFVNLNSRSVLYTAQSKSIIHSFYQVFVMIIQVCFFIYLLLTDLSQIFSFCFIQAKTVPKFWTLVSSPLPIYCSAFSRLLYLPVKLFCW